MAPRHAAVLVTTGHAATPYRLWPVDSSYAAGALFALLGDITPGPGRPVTIPTTVLDEVLRTVPEPSVWALADALRSRAVPGPDATDLAHLSNHASTVAQWCAHGQHVTRDQDPRPTHYE